MVDCFLYRKDGSIFLQRSDEMLTNGIDEMLAVYLLEMGNQQENVVVY